MIKLLFKNDRVSFALSLGIDRSGTCRDMKYTIVRKGEGMQPEGHMSLRRGSSTELTEVAGEPSHISSELRASTDKFPLHLSSVTTSLRANQFHSSA